MILCSHSARSSLWDRKEVQTELRGRPVRRSAGKTKQNKNSSREWAGRSQSRNRALGFRGAPVPWQTKQRNTVWFSFLLHTRPSFLSFPLLCLRCFFDHIPSSSLLLAWDILYISMWMHALIFTQTQFISYSFAKRVLQQELAVSNITGFPFYVNGGATVWRESDWAR